MTSTRILYDSFYFRVDIGNVAHCNHPTFHIEIKFNTLPKSLPDFNMLHLFFFQLYKKNNQTQRDAITTFIKEWNKDE